MSRAATVVDKVLEAPVVTSFTRIGYAARRRLDGWTPLDSYDLTGRVIAITGPTSGLGKAAAEQLARCGATLLLIARNAKKAEVVRDGIAAATGNDDLAVVVADMSDLGQVRRAAGEILSAHERLDVLIHNAGALSNQRRTSPDGTELTIAVQVVGPFLLTGLLLDRLTATPGSRVLTMASGGMYATGLSVGGLEMDEASYKGAEQYARAKRAQVTLNEMWAGRAADTGVTFHALHPGWADTPGVEASLPTFRKIVGPFLRNAAQGADTLVWLAADDGAPLASNGKFWLDRRLRPIHRAPTTRRSDTPERRARLWTTISAKAGWNLGTD